MSDQVTDTHSPTPATEPLALRLSEGLGLAPERAGQPRLMTVTPEQADNMHGHWYSPAAVREMLAAERERWQSMLLSAVAEAALHARQHREFVVKVDESGWWCESKA